MASNMSKTQCLPSSRSIPLARDPAEATAQGSRIAGYVNHRISPKKVLQHYCLMKMLPVFIYYRDTAAPAGALDLSHMSASVPENHAGETERGFLWHLKASVTATAMCMK